MGRKKLLEVTIPDQQERARRQQFFDKRRKNIFKNIFEDKEKFNDNTDCIVLRFLKMIEGQKNDHD